MHRSVATLDQLEFLNLSPLDINPLMSSCTIKVLYTGPNRNGSMISKEVAAEMAKTLRGAPIVGYFKKDKGDFGDHEEFITIDGNGVHIDTRTVPYGFVAPDAKVWFQNFIDYDSNGNGTPHTYLVTTGYLWTGQFEEARKAHENGQPESMELDKDTMTGSWTEYAKDVELYIVKDAIFSKLCILGDDVEPCFEGSSILAGEENNKFSQTLFSMMQDLKFALQGGQKEMTDNIIESASLTPVVACDTITSSIEDTISVGDFTVVTPEPAIEEAIEAPIIEEKGETGEPGIPASEFKKEEEEKKEESTSEDKEESKDEPAKEEDKKDEDEEDKKKRYSLLESEYETLKNNYSLLEQKYNELVEFKAQIEDKEKDALIAKFFMLSDEDKRDVIQNKRNYTLEEIEGKLSIAYVRSDSKFGVDAAEEPEEAPALTYSLNECAESNTPAWLKAVEEHRNMNN